MPEPLAKGTLREVMTTITHDGERLSLNRSENTDLRKLCVEFLIMAVELFEEQGAFCEAALVDSVIHKLWL